MSLNSFWLTVEGTTSTNSSIIGLTTAAGPLGVGDLRHQHSGRRSHRRSRRCIGAYDKDLQSLMLQCWVSAVNTVSYRLHNPTAGSITPTTGNVSFLIQRNPLR